MTNTLDHSNEVDRPEIDAILTDALRTQMPLADLMQVSASEGSAERVATHAVWQPQFCGIGGVLHGGYLMSLADGTGATLAFLNLSSDERTTTIESKTNFFRPVTEGSVHAVATIIHRGRTTIVVQTDVTDDGGSLVSRTMQTQAVRSAGQR